MGSSHSKQSKQQRPSKDRTHPVHPQPKPPVSQRPRTPYPDTPPKKLKQRTRIPKVPQPQPRDFNAFLAAAGFGYSQIIDDNLLREWHATQCCRCGGRVSAERGQYFVLHNTQGCQAAYHDRCMTEHLDKYVDRCKRQGRPRCVKCLQDMNVRLGKATKQNPIGFVQF